MTKQTEQTPNALADSMQDALNDWVDSLYFRFYSPHTIVSYKRAVQAFGVGCGLNDWRACHKSHVQQYFSKRLENGLDVNSAKQQVSALGQFFAFLLDKQLCSSNPMTGYRIKGATGRLPKLVDVDLMVQLLDQPVPACPKDERLWRRDRAMFELLYGSGLRIGELVGLDEEDVDLNTRTIIVLGKGKKTRQVPIGKKAMVAIKAYLPIRLLWQSKGKKTSALFISQRQGRLTTRAVQLRLSVCATRAGIDQALHPHLLRHAFASHLLSSSGDLRAVQELLGHSNLATTQIYTHLDFGALAQVYDKAHPRAN